MTKNQFNTQILQQYHALHLYALHFTHDGFAASDLVQDTMLRAISNYNKFTEDTNLKGWLFTIMKNIFINNYRYRGRNAIRFMQTSDISSANLALSATKNQGEVNFIMDDIIEAMSKLPKEYYIPFTLYFNGHKYREIAVKLVIPMGTVKTRIHIARRLLMKALKPYSNQL